MKKRGALVAHVFDVHARLCLAMNPGVGPQARLHAEGVLHKDYASSKNPPILRNFS